MGVVDWTKVDRADDLRAHVGGIDGGPARSLSMHVAAIIWVKRRP